MASRHFLPKNYIFYKQTKPNGNRLKFEYETVDDKPWLSRVWTINRKGKMINWVNFKYSDAGCTLESSCGKSVEYLHTHSSFNRSLIYKKLLTNVNSSQKGKISYDTCIWPVSNVYRVNKPDGRFTQVGCRNGKVVKLMQNKGEYLFTYHKHNTLVVDPLGQETIYQFDHNMHLQSISYMDKDLVARQEMFLWDETDECEGRLLLRQYCSLINVSKYSHFHTMKGKCDKKNSPWKLDRREE